MMKPLLEELVGEAGEERVERREDRKGRSV